MALIKDLEAKHVHFPADVPLSAPSFLPGSPEGSYDSIFHTSPPALGEAFSGKQEIKTSKGYETPS